MKVIALVNHKGGVGKTTTTLNLGKALSLLGKKVLMIDNDPQGNLSQSVGCKDFTENLYHTYCENKELPVQKLTDFLGLVPTDLSLSVAETKLITDVNGYFRLRKALLNLPEKYDYVLIDCPPSLGILTLNALIAANSFLLVVQAQYLAVQGLQTILDLVANIKENLNTSLYLQGILITQVNRTLANKIIMNFLQTHHEHTIFSTTIRQNTDLVEATIANQDIFTYNAKSNGAEDYAALAQEILQTAN